MKNRRRIKRQELDVELNLFNAETGGLLGKLADITTEGLLLFSNKPITLQREYLLEIRLEGLNAAMFYNDGESKRVRFKAFSLWQIKTDYNHYKTGFRMRSITPADLVSVSYLIRKFRKKEQERQANTAAEYDVNHVPTPLT